MAVLPEWASPSAIVARVRSLYRGALRRNDLESEMREEFAHHLSERTDDLIRQGHAPKDAERQARKEFGHTGTHRARAREAMGLASLAQLRFSWLDVKLGLRMLRKHPMLSAAAVFALAVGIPVGLAPSHVARALKAPLPGDTDNRVRAIRYWDPLSSSVESTTDEEFTFWAERLGSFSSLAAFRASRYNVAAADGPAAPAAGALLSATALGVLDARPLLGRVFDGGDFAAGASNVVLIGYDLWSSRFGRDPGMLGRSIRVGQTLHTVVGVMPNGFRFPANQSIWLPLRNVSSGGVAEGTRVRIIGRLADGVSAVQAQSELSAIGAPPLSAADETDARARLRPEVVPFGLLYMGLPASGLEGMPEYRVVQLLMFVLLLVACGNVAMLVFARTATRFREIAIRTALGASRARIVSQIFVETLLLSVIAAGVGVFVVDWALQHINLAALAGESELPYWLSLNVSRATALSAFALAAVSATVAGVVPAIAVTGRAITRNMQGRSGVRFGGFTGALVVADIAVSVAAVGMAIAISGSATDLQAANRATGIPAAEYLAAEIRLFDDAGVSGNAVSTAATEGEPADVEANRTRQRLATNQRELVAALEREPGVKRVAVSSVLPRMDHRSQPFEVDGARGAPDETREWVRVARVDVEYLRALEHPILRGRDFARTDVEGTDRVAIVNTAFVERRLNGDAPLGRRVRFPSPTDRGEAEWYVIVGVVGPLGVNMVNAERGEAVYLPAAPGTMNPMQLGIHASVPPASLTGRVRALATAVDPDLVVGRTAVLSDIRQGDWYLMMGLAGGLIVLVGVLLALATSGLYAMLSLSVSERTREIGIRAALGAPQRALLTTILRRSLVQIGLGAALGLPIAARFVYELTSTPEESGSLMLSTAAALGLALTVVALVGLCSCLVPTRRVLAIEASEAMRADS